MAFCYHVYMIKYPERYFNGKPIRAIWDADKAIWRYSAVDFITVLINPHSPRRYWNNVKVRNPQLLEFCSQAKLYASDNKKYLTDVINEDGVRFLLTIVPSKYKKEIQDWLKGMLDPIDEQSKRKAYQLYQTSLISEDEIGKTIALQKIHAFLFEGLYTFAGQIRSKTIAKGGFVFANGDFLPQILPTIDKMVEDSVDHIVEKYVEMNIAHPFLEGNGRATRIWLDLILIKNLKKCIDWSKIDKDEYLLAMKESPFNDLKIKQLLKDALTEEIDDRELFLKGIDTSYYYER